MADFYHDGFDSVRQLELDWVRGRWTAKAGRRGWTGADGHFDQESLRGIAFSGGGIRSASFCMGVLQELHLSGVLDRAHYLSTVSGGGYTGSSLTWFMTQDFGTTADDFPFWGGKPAAARNAAPLAARKQQLRTKQRTGPLDGRIVLDYIRQRASYLNPGAGFTIVSALAIVLRSVLATLLGYVLIVALLFAVASRLGVLGRPLFGREAILPGPLAALARLDWLALGGFALLAALGASIVLYSLLTGIGGAGRAAYALRRGYQRIAGFALAAAVGLLLASLVVFIVGWLAGGGLSLKEIAAVGGGSTALGTAGGFVAKGLAGAAPTARNKILITLLPPVFLFLLVTGLAFVGAAVAAYFGRLNHGGWILLAVTLVYCLFSNINLTGLHRFYRDRLMESFMADPEDISLDGAAAPTDADEADLAGMCSPEQDGPYHLVNTHVVLAGSNKSRQRSRRGDSFLLSPLFCGSEATGFIRTKDWLPGRARVALGRRVGAIKLATAMAISGAALNPRTGADGQGGAKGGAISALLTILNMRLGYWVPSPKRARARWRPSYYAPPNFIFPGLVQGLIGAAHDQDAHWLELSDGGHFENTGIYELVRRGVRTIVFADGSTDPEISLSSFANVLEKVFIDFGVTISFDSKADFIEILKGTADADAGVLAQRLSLSKRAFAVATIGYPDGRSGKLFYIKSTLVPGLPASLYSYKAGNPLFPSESLADQFFGEQQFEAYRTLGLLLTRQMVAAARRSRDWSARLGIDADADAEQVEGEWAQPQPAPRDGRK